MVTGGFRSRRGMEIAVAEGDCDLIGLGRPAVLNPAAPANTILSKEVADGNATLYTRTIHPPWFLQYLGLNMVGAGAETVSTCLSSYSLLLCIEVDVDHLADVVWRTDTKDGRLIDLHCGWKPGTRLDADVDGDIT